MQIDTIIREGLAFEQAQDENGFREWAAKWMPGINDQRGLHARFLTHDRVAVYFSPETLEVWAFRAREMAGDKWERGIQAVFTVVCNDNWYGACMWEQVARSSAYHWIICGIVALEMGKEKKE